MVTDRCRKEERVHQLDQVIDPPRYGQQREEDKWGLNEVEEKRLNVRCEPSSISRCTQN